MSQLTEKMTPELIRKYSAGGAYYTSYPALAQWRGDFGDADYAPALQAACVQEQDPLLLYVHFPFCAKQCYYCICNSVISTKHEHFQQLINSIGREVDLIKGILDRQAIRPRIDMIHLGGGTPNLMNEEELALLVSKLKGIVNTGALKEFSVEIDARTVNMRKLLSYADHGVTRLSFGIQDFDPMVQKAINRWQPLELIQQTLSDDVRRLYRGINFDVIYGLPLQSPDSLKKTIQEVIRLSPDRITLLRYGHVPDKKAHMKSIRQEDLPSADMAEELHRDAIERLLSNGYEYVGLNHFAKADDELAVARRNRSLWRNFIGFSWGGPHDLLGIGPTSTSGFGSYYAQNYGELEQYYQALDQGKLPVHRGYTMTVDDRLRREIINSLLCQAGVDFAVIEKKYRIDFRQKFALELQGLRTFVEDGMAEILDGAIRVKPCGELYVRHMCRVFDTFVR